MLATLLVCPEYATRLAFDGEAALEEAMRFDPQVILLDIGLPKLDGYGVARQLRARESALGPRIEIIAMTGFGRDDDRRKAFEAGFDHHLVKPLDLAKLLALIAKPRD